MPSSALSLVSKQHPPQVTAEELGGGAMRAAGQEEGGFMTHFFGTSLSAATAIRSVGIGDRAYRCLTHRHRFLSPTIPIG